MRYYQKNTANQIQIIQLFPSHLLLNKLNMIYLYIMQMSYLMSALQSKGLSYLKSRPPNINMQTSWHGYNKDII